jgi:hypothetical protein
MNVREINLEFSTKDRCLRYVEQMKRPDGVMRCPTSGDRYSVTGEGEKWYTPGGGSLFLRRARE